MQLLHRLSESCISEDVYPNVLFVPMQCFDTIAAREISGQLLIEGSPTLTDPGEYGDWAVLNHYNTIGVSYYAFHQLTLVDARSAMILLEPQSSTPQGRPQNASSIMAVD